MVPRILILSGEPEHWDKLSEAVYGSGWLPVRCETISDAKRVVNGDQIDAIVCDDVLPDGDFRALINELRRSACPPPVVVVSRLDDWGPYLDAMVAGAFDYVAYPPYPHDLERVVNGALAESSSQRKAMAETAA